MYNHAPDGYRCPFCMLVEGIENEHVYSVQSDVVCRDEAVTAFVSSHQWPRNHGNVIVVPNEHYENIYDLPPAMAAEIQIVARSLALAMKAVYGCDGVSTRQHNEPAGNQDVWHYHLHVTPRYLGDQFYATAHKRKKLMPIAERAQHAARLRSYLAGSDGDPSPRQSENEGAEMTLEAVNYFWGLFEDPDHATAANASKRFQLGKPPLPAPVVASFQDEGIAGLGGDYGLPGKGSPTEVDHLDFVVDGRQGSIRVVNRGISMLVASTPELVRLHRFFSVLQKQCT